MRLQNCPFVWIPVAWIPACAGMTKRKIVKFNL